MGGSILQGTAHENLILIAVDGHFMVYSVISSSGDNYYMEVICA